MFVYIRFQDSKTSVWFLRCFEQNVLYSKFPNLLPVPVNDLLCRILELWDRGMDLRGLDYVEDVGALCEWDK